MIYLWHAAVAFARVKIPNSRHGRRKDDSVHLECRRRGQHEPKTWQGAKSLKGILIPMMKLQCQQGLAVRRLPAANQTTMILPQDHAVVEAIIDMVEARYLHDFCSNIASRLFEYSGNQTA